MKTRQLLKLLHGAATFVPGVERMRAVRTGGTDSARYCYSIWMRHLVRAFENGARTHPKVVAELGPGDSLGIGLSALLSGVEKYYAFDVVEHSNPARNLAVLHDLVSLFEQRTDIPGEDELPGVHPRLASYEFPKHILGDERLSRALAADRIDRITDSIRHPRGDTSMIVYRAPWDDPGVIAGESVDMIYSQAVMEHVDDLKETYRAMRMWLAPNGLLSHQIDFGCHETADQWNGHWTYSELMWKLMRGRRSYLLNREPHSTHIRLLAEEGFGVWCDDVIRSQSFISREKLAGRFAGLSDDDLNTRGAFIQAVKLPHHGDR